MKDSFYLGRDNVMEWRLLEDASIQNLSTLAITKMELDVGGTVISSATSPTAFDWDTYSDRLVLDLADEVLPEGSFSGCRLIVYTSDHSSGIVWADNIELHIKPE